MKQALDYLEDLFEKPYNLDGNSIESDFLEVIKQCQIDAIESTAIEGARCGLINDNEWQTIVDNLKQQLG